MRITGLFTYPVKGCRRIEHDAAVVEPWGLAGDRRWLLVDADGVGLTQRDEPRIALLTVRERPGGLELVAPGRPAFVVDEPVDGSVDGSGEFVRVFRAHAAAPARVAGSGDAAAWVSAFLGRPARLVWQADPTGRSIPDREYATDPVNFADGFPLLAANEASLSALNDWLVESGDDPVPMARFRPNVVIAGAAPWAEDEWTGKRLRIGDLTLRVANPCPRCVVTTIDQDTAERGRQPLFVLGRYRRFARGLLFARALIPMDPNGGSLRVGDPVTVLT
ncbi:MOSC domain-containing protein [Paractinoplanes rishiriensis]|uniref:Molybdenum cofactor biosysynthesis protein n=1 Tax=Paractinoplanes rishiriensis TaxID=1050105 RepID=A0A919K316_9ACTN|nr:MOSC N-terminal beta barrel domain-containing protein [Actinoplanes rishiriensis]GIE95711.1 molybdenum cofactor biosysynthesis protein [Actinoplanes rishiriensis]